MQTWCFKSINLALDPVFYNSGDPEFKDPIGPLIAENTITCDLFNFSYSTKIIAQRISDNGNLLIANFPIAVNGATTSGDYLSFSTSNYKDSPYTVKISLTATLPDRVSII